MHQERLLTFSHGVVGMNSYVTFHGIPTKPTIERARGFLTVRMDIGAFRSRFPAVSGQLVRYGFIGAALNIGGYLFYLWLTFNGFDPKAAATIAFIVGVVVGFLCHRRFTFRHAGDVRQPVVRYLSAYLMGYAANMLGLYALVDVLHYPHEIVQAGLIVAIAIGLFIAQKFWIFIVRSTLA